MTLFDILSGTVGKEWKGLGCSKLSSDLPKPQPHQQLIMQLVDSAVALVRADVVEARNIAEELSCCQHTGEGVIFRRVVNKAG